MLTAAFIQFFFVLHIEELECSSIVPDLEESATIVRYFERIHPDYCIYRGVSPPLGQYTTRKCAFTTIIISIPQTRCDLINSWPDPTFQQIEQSMHRENMHRI